MSPLPPRSAPPASGTCGTAPVPALEPGTGCHLLTFSSFLIISAIFLASNRVLIQGEQILDELLQLSQHGITVRIAVSRPSAKSPLNDLQALEQSGE